MDLQDYISNHISAVRKASFKTSPQINLGQLIELVKICDREDAEVVFDFGYFHPTSLDSWRGAYYELALDYTEKGTAMTRNYFLKLLNEAIGKEYSGYKGGEFTMSEETPVWVSNYGQSANTAVVGVKNGGYQIIIQTAHCEF